MNPDAPYRPQGYNSKEGSKKVAAAFAKDPSLKARVEKAIQDWKATQSSSEPAATIDDGKPPSNPSTYTAQYAVSNIVTVDKRDDRDEQDDYDEQDKRDKDLTLNDNVKPIKELIALPTLNNISSYNLILYILLLGIKNILYIFTYKF